MGSLGKENLGSQVESLFAVEQHQPEDASLIDNHK